MDGNSGSFQALSRRRRGARARKRSGAPAPRASSGRAGVCASRPGRVRRTRCSGACWGRERAARRRRPGARRDRARPEPGAGARGVGREPDGRRDHERPHREAALEHARRLAGEGGGEDVRRAHAGGAQGLRRRRRGPARHGGSARRRVTKSVERAEGFKAPDVVRMRIARVRTSSRAVVTAYPRTRRLGRASRASSRGTAREAARRTLARATLSAAPAWPPSVISWYSTLGILVDAPRVPPSGWTS